LRDCALHHPDSQECSLNSRYIALGALSGELYPQHSIVYFFLLHLSFGRYYMSKTVAVRGAFFDFIDDPWKHVGEEEKAARFYEDGLLVVEDGIIKTFGPYDKLAASYSSVETTHLTSRLILPCFINGHIHVPQTRI